MAGVHTDIKMNVIETAGVITVDVDLTMALQHTRRNKIQMVQMENHYSVTHVSPSCISKMKGIRMVDRLMIRTDWQTINKENFHLVCNIGVSIGWKIHCLDIKAAFLQGAAIERAVHLLPPLEGTYHQTLEN